MDTPYRIRVGSSWLQPAWDEGETVADSIAAILGQGSAGSHTCPYRYVI
jgi:hypothetical protein